MTATAPAVPPEPLPLELESVGLIDMAKILRITAAAVALDEAITWGPLDEAALRRIDGEVAALLVETGSALPDDLLTELGRLVEPLQHPDHTPDEVRITLSLLIGWLLGVERSLPVGS